MALLVSHGEYSHLVLPDPLPTPPHGYPMGGTTCVCGALALALAFEAELAGAVDDRLTVQPLWRQQNAAK
jgi:hypothetical protein